MKPIEQTRQTVARMRANGATEADIDAFVEERERAEGESRPLCPRCGTVHHPDYRC